MLRLAAIIYVMAATAIVGICVTAVLATPSLADEFAKWIMIAAVGGALISAPISYYLAKVVNAQIKGK